MYTAGQLAQIAGTSVRALHHYEQQGLLHPRRRTNGYREYGPQDVARLQQVLLFRACGMPLSAVKGLLDDPAFDPHAALQQQLETLEAQHQNLERLMNTVRTTIRALEGACTMTDTQKFEGLKQAAINANESHYGAEARERWGDAAIDAAHEKLLGMDERTWNDMQALEGAIIEQLKAAMAENAPDGAVARKLAAMHQRWIQLHWGDGAYSPQAHLALAQGYLADARFTDYYDSRAGEGATAFLVQALRAYLA